MVADLDSAGGIDFDLGRCGSCGAAVMRCWWSGVTGHEVLAEDEAQRLLGLQSDPAARIARIFRSKGRQAQRQG